MPWSFVPIKQCWMQWNLFTPDISLKVETILKFQKRDPVLKMVYKWITEKSRPVKKTLIIAGSPFLLYYYRTFPKLYIDENTKLITIKTQPLQINDDLPQYIGDNFSSHTSHFGLPLTMFRSACDKTMNTRKLIWILHILLLPNKISLHFSKNGYQFSFITALNAKLSNFLTMVSLWILRSIQLCFWRKRLHL